MEFDKRTIRKILGIATFIILLYWGLQNLTFIGQILGIVFGLISPFLFGGAIAFILNVPMRFIERQVFQRNVKMAVPAKNTAAPSRAEKMKKALARPLSLVITLLLMVGLVFVVMFLIVPELGRSFNTLKDSIPHFVREIQDGATKFIADYPDIANQIMNLNFNFDWNEIGKTLFNFVQNGAGTLLSSTISLAASIFSGLFSLFMAFIFAIYVLLQKEKLSSQCKRTLYAFVPEPIADKALNIMRLSERTFSNFLSGQCIEAVILGVMFFIAMSLFRFPYALMVSVLISFTALIPIFGAFIGCFVGAFLILIVDPMQAVWFLVMFLILQQVEGNLIYPRVVGGSIGLPSIWVLVAVTVGGSMFGVGGMLIFIPLCSVLYALLRETVGKRLKARKILPQKMG